ncbi:MAG: hypothetical protein AAFY20_08710 [Cyanobacteria bacterium J06639_14]
MVLLQEPSPPKPSCEEILDTLTGPDLAARDRMLALLEANPDVPAAALPGASRAVNHIVFGAETLEVEFQTHRIVQELVARFGDDTTCWALWTVFGWLDGKAPGLGFQSKYERVLDLIDEGEIA